MDTTIERENAEKFDIIFKELKERMEELETKIGNGSQFEAKSLQE